jgi:hypothetical protein
MEAMTEEGDALAIRVDFASMSWKVLGDEDLAHDALTNIMELTANEESNSKTHVAYCSMNHAYLSSLWKAGAVSKGVL